MRTQLGAVQRDRTLRTHSPRTKYATRYNPEAREPWVREDNFSLAKAVADANFGILNSTLNEPRRMQLGLKLYW